MWSGGGISSVDVPEGCTVTVCESGWSTTYGCVGERWDLASVRLLSREQRRGLSLMLCIQGLRTAAAKDFPDDTISAATMACGGDRTILDTAAPLPPMKR